MIGFRRELLFIQKNNDTTIAKVFPAIPRIVTMRVMTPSGREKIMVIASISFVLFEY